jgi:hypothetical protein
VDHNFELTTPKKLAQTTKIGNVAQAIDVDEIFVRTLFAFTFRFV